MNKPLKILITICGITVLLSGIVYAGSLIYQKINKNNQITFEPTYESTLDENTINNIWVGTLDLAWKELEEILGDKVELDGNVEIANELNESEF